MKKKIYIFYILLITIGLIISYYFYQREKVKESSYEIIQAMANNDIKKLSKLTSHKQSSINKIKLKKISEICKGKTTGLLMLDQKEFSPFKPKTYEVYLIVSDLNDPSDEGDYYSFLLTKEEKNKYKIENNGLTKGLINEEK